MHFPHAIWELLRVRIFHNKNITWNYDVKSWALSSFEKLNIPTASYENTKQRYPTRKSEYWRLTIYSKNIITVSYACRRFLHFECHRQKSNWLMYLKFQQRTNSVCIHHIFDSIHRIIRLLSDHLLRSLRLHDRLTSWKTVFINFYSSIQISRDTYLQVTNIQSNLKGRMNILQSCSISSDRMTSERSVQTIIWNLWQERTQWLLFCIEIQYRSNNQISICYQEMHNAH